MAPDRHPGAVPILSDPLPGRWERSLRDEVRALRQGPPRRMPATLHAGRPGGPRVDLPLAALGGVDPTLRVDVADALLDRAGRLVADPWLWLSRLGTVHPDEYWEDHHWSVAFAQVCAQSPVLAGTAAFAVLTRSGWYDPRGDCGRRWARLRTRVVPRP